ncbi:MAG: universal stress protein [Thermoplasmata archaeon]|nr:universal stress protein [Thermoplasmata archaeon]MCI4342271.1 universal stress protein [Thermoplasmata archaeon]
MAPVVLRRIAVSVDGSAHAAHALEFAVDLARKYSAELTIVAVAPLTAYVATTEPWIPTEVLEGEVKHYRTIVDESVAMAKAAGITAVTGVCLEGHITEELVGFVEKHPLDLLIMGSRGLSTTKRLLLGSTSDEVLHHVNCPVLIVRTPAVP